MVDIPCLTFLGFVFFMFILFTFILGTDLIKKRMNENGEAGNEEYDFGHLKGMPNHNPHGRSHSVLVRKGNFDEDHLDSSLSGGLMSSPEDSPVHHAHSEQNHLNPSSLLSPNPLNFSSSSKDNVSIPNHSPRNRSPSLKIRRYSFLAGSRRGRGFSEIFNSTILNDHFDQYSAQRDDSGLGRDLLPGEDKYRANHIGDPSPDSGVSESMDEDAKNKSLQRRRTMPCIVKDDDDVKQTVREKETAISSENIAGKNPETYVIENGIRKRIKGIQNKINPSVSRGNLPNAFRIESEPQLRPGKHGSLPDIHTVQTSDQIKPMSREEAYQLGTARREELRRLQEIAERRRQGDVGVILGDLKVR